MSEELNIEERVTRLEQAVFDGNRDKPKSKYWGAGAWTEPLPSHSAQSAPNVTTTVSAGASAFGGVPPFAVKSPEPRRPVPKKQTQSTYGWSYRKETFTALNFAEHCAFYFTGVKNRLRRFSKQNDENAMLYAYLSVIIKNIKTEIFEKDVAIDTRKIIKATDDIVDLLKKHPTRGSEIVKALEYMDKVRNLFE